MKWLVYIFFAGIIFLLAGCATKGRAFNAKTSTAARAKIKFKDTIAIFDATFAKSEDGGTQVVLYKNLPPAIATATLEPDGTAHFEGFGKSWQGEQSAAPAAVAPLLSLASLYASENTLPNGQREIHTPALRMGMEVSRGRLRSATAASNDGPFAASADF